MGGLTILVQLFQLGDVALLLTIAWVMNYGDCDYICYS